MGETHAGGIHAGEVWWARYARAMAMLLPIGYAAKLTTVPPVDWPHPAQVLEIGSVSGCIARHPDYTLTPWYWNELGFFNSLAELESTFPERAVLDVFAYRALSDVYSNGVVVPLPSLAEPVLGTTRELRSLGFDVVSSSVTDNLECSPLSCNGMCNSFPVNGYCLFPELAAATEVARSWSQDGPEPGDYYVVEVLRVGPADFRQVAPAGGTG